MTKSIKGTQTEKNLLTSFAGESQARIGVTLILQVLQRRKVTNKFQQSSQRQLIRKRNTLNVCSSSWKVVW